MIFQDQIQRKIQMTQQQVPMREDLGPKQQGRCPQALNKSHLTVQKFQMLAEYTKGISGWDQSYLSNHHPVCTQGTVQGQVFHFM